MFLFSSGLLFLRGRGTRNYVFFLSHASWLLTSTSKMLEVDVISDSCFGDWSQSWRSCKQEPLIDVTNGKCRQGQYERHTHMDVSLRGRKQVLTASTSICRSWDRSPEVMLWIIWDHWQIHIYSNFCFQNKQNNKKKYEQTRMWKDDLQKYGMFLFLFVIIGQIELNVEMVKSCYRTYFKMFSHY